MTIQKLAVFGLRSQADEVTHYNAIQIQPTVEEEMGICRAANEYEEITHWSIYGRKADGTAEWIADFAANREVIARACANHLAWMLDVPLEGPQSDANMLVNIVRNFNQKGTPQ